MRVVVDDGFGCDFEQSIVIYNSKQNVNVRQILSAQFVKKMLQLVELFLTVLNIIYLYLFLLKEYIRVPIFL